MKKTPISLLTAAVIGLAPIASAVTLNDLTHGYDVFVEDNLDLSSGNIHIHGSAAAGQDVFSNSSDFNMDGVSGSTHSLLVGDELILSGNQSKVLNSGTARIGTQGPLGIDGGGNKIGTNNGTDNTRLELNGATQTSAETFGPSGIDFGAAFASLTGFSESLKALTPTLDFANIDLNNWNYNIGNSGTVNILNLTGAQLASIVNMNFGTLAGASDKLIINIDLTGFAGTISQNRNGEEAADHMLWNFFGAGSLTLQNQFIGSILATGVDLVHQNNDIKGGVIAKSFTKSGGQVHVHGFDYDITEVPDSGSTALLALLSLPVFVALRRRLK